MVGSQIAKMYALAEAALAVAESTAFLRERLRTERLRTVDGGWRLVAESSEDDGLGLDEQPGEREPAVLVDEERSEASLR